MTQSPGARRGATAGGVRLTRVDQHSAAIEALAATVGGRVPLTSLLEDLTFRATKSRRGRLAGRAVQHAIAFDRHDQRDRVWWPQGITTSADADPTGVVAGRRLVVTTWYAKPADGVRRGSRLTFLDLDTLRYRHVLLVEPKLDAEGRLGLESVRIHAGGLVWAGPWLHVAATARGFVSFHVDDLLRVPDDNAHPGEIGVRDLDGVPRVTSFGHHHVLPVRMVHRALADEGTEPLRYSFLSLDRTSTPPELVAGEYGRGAQSTRLAHFDLDPDTLLPAGDESGPSRPALTDARTRQMQGAVVARGRHHVSTSRGPWVPGSIWTGDPERLRRHRFAVPMGPEDLTYWPERDTLWSVTEHPRRRWIVEMRRSWFD